MQYLVDFGKVKGVRRRRYFETLSQAREAARLFKQEQDQCGDVWAQMTASDRVKVTMMLEEMNQEKTTLTEVWNFWKEHRDIRNGHTLGKAIDELLEAKADANLSEDYLKELANYLGQFQRGREEIDIVDITPNLLKAWFDSRDEAPATKQTGINRLSALFSFCVRRGYIRENPIKRIERIRVPQKNPEILTNKQCKDLVDAATEIDRGMLTYLGLALFCGIRPDESKRLRRSSIQIDRRLVRLDAEKAKVRDHRIVQLTAPAVRCIEAGSEVPFANFRRRFKALRDKAKITDWPHDALRKTAASHFYNIYGIDKATEQLGHSAGVLLNVYRELVSKEQTDEWLAITAETPEQPCDLA